MGAAMVVMVSMSRLMATQPIGGALSQLVRQHLNSGESLSTGIKSGVEGKWNRNRSLAACMVTCTAGPLWVLRLFICIMSLGLVRARAHARRELGKRLG